VTENENALNAFTQIGVKKAYRYDFQFILKEYFFAYISV
jgi:hypothetical protein